MIDIILLAVAGVGAGIITGLIPGVHPNTLAVFLLSVSGAMLAVFSLHAVVVFMVSMAITHSFLSFIPSVFIGAPEGGTALSVLPGHRLLLEGLGYEAVYLTVVGGLGVVMLSVLLLPLLMVALPVFYSAIRGYIAFVLLGIAAVMVGTERGRKKALGLGVFLMAGVLGIIVLNMPIVAGQFLLFPVFTGLFGISTLAISFLSGIRVPEQKMGRVRVPRGTSVAGIVKGFMSGMVVGILPGIGAAQAGVLVHHLTGRKGLREFLVALGGINTVAALFSLMALYLISRPRSGVAVAVSKLMEGFGFPDLLLLIAAALFAAGIAAVVTLRLTRVFAGFIQRVSYKKLSSTVICFLVGLVVLFTGLPGLLLLGASTSIGLLPPLLGVKRTHCMSVLMSPIIIWYLGIVV
ncbi:MAG: tripartite tricarboxylate transporter permease [Candidatus Aenigmatarchaeota archaeon]